LRIKQRHCRRKNAGAGFANIIRKEVITLDVDTEWEELLAAYGNSHGRVRNPGYSSVFTVESADSIDTIEKVDAYARTANTSIESLMSLNRIVRGLCNSDDSIGRAIDAINSNINTKYKLSWPAKADESELNESKRVIEGFNKEIALERFIRDSLVLTYAEGNFIGYLNTRNGEHSIMQFPIGVARVVNFMQGVLPVCVVDMDVMQKRLAKYYPKGKSGGKLLLENISDEIKKNMPPELASAYDRKERYAVLETERTGLVRYMNLGGLYGISPMVKAIRPRMILDSAEKRDIANDGAKSTKIIVQRMSDKLLGPNGDKMELARAKYSHEGLMKSMEYNGVVVYTAPPGVEAVEFIEPKVEDVPTEKIAMYKSRIMSALGISFADAGSKNWSASQINISQLLRTINSIAEEIEYIIQRWYGIVLQENGINADFAPKIQILDSELLDAALRKDLAMALFNTFGCSYRTAYGLLEIDAAEEAAERQAEYEKGYDEAFYPHATAYTRGANDAEAGRPSGEESEKQEYDEGYQEGTKG
jgi:hypothetical protein